MSAAGVRAYFKDFDLIKNGSLFGYAPPEINQTRSHIGYHMATRPGAQRIKHQKINKKTRATAGGARDRDALAARRLLNSTGCARVSMAGSPDTGPPIYRAGTISHDHAKTVL